MTKEEKFNLVLVAILVIGVLIMVFSRQISEAFNPSKESRSTFDACTKFAKDCSRKYGTPAWVSSRCEVLWESCMGTWGRDK